MPVHSFSKANSDNLAKLRNDPFQFDLTTTSGLFTLSWKLDFVTFVREIMFNPDAEVDETTGRRDVKDIRPMVDCIHDCLIVEDQDRFTSTIDKSTAARKTADPAADADVVARETLVALYDAVIAYYRGDAPLEDSGSSATSPSTDGTNSTPSSSTAAFAPDTPAPTAAPAQAKLIQE